jgi:hypothetical protein
MHKVEQSVTIWQKFRFGLAVFIDIIMLIFLLVTLVFIWINYLPWSRLKEYPAFSFDLQIYPSIFPYGLPVVALLALIGAISLFCYFLGLFPDDFFPQRLRNINFAVVGFGGPLIILFVIAFAIVGVGIGILLGIKSLERVVARHWKVRWLLSETERFVVLDHEIEDNFHDSNSRKTSFSNPSSNPSSHSYPSNSSMHISNVKSESDLKDDDNYTSTYPDK